jgi:hypothetical protein
MNVTQVLRAFHAICYEIESKSDIVKLELKKFDYDDDKCNLVFWVKFVFHDEYISNVYNEGKFIYLSDNFYSDVSKLFKKYVGRYITWNNAGNVGRICIELGDSK